MGYSWPESHPAPCWPQMEDLGFFFYFNEAVSYFVPLTYRANQSPVLWICPKEMFKCICGLLCLAAFDQQLENDYFESILARSVFSACQRDSRPDGPKLLEC